MKVRTRKYKTTEEAPSYWPSFVDVMSTAALVFFFLMILAMGNLNIFVDDISVKREKLYNQIEGKLQSNKVDKNIIRFNKREGKIEIKTETFFDTGKYDLKPDGVAAANLFNKIFYDLLSDEKISNEIQYIEVVGHTDFSGSTFDNRDLSTKRAISFLNKIVPMNSVIENKFGGKFKASGMSEFETNPNVKMRNRGPEDYDYNKTAPDRKIEVRMVFKNTDLENAIKQRAKSNKNK